MKPEAVKHANQSNMRGDGDNDEQQTSSQGMGDKGKPLRNDSSLYQRVEDRRQTAGGGGQHASLQPYTHKKQNEHFHLIAYTHDEDEHPDNMREQLRLRRGSEHANTQKTGMIGNQAFHEEHNDSSGLANQSNQNAIGMGVINDNINKKAMSEKVEGRATVPQLGG